MRIDRTSKKALGKNKNEHTTATATVTATAKFVCGGCKIEKQTKRRAQTLRAKPLEQSRELRAMRERESSERQECALSSLMSRRYSGLWSVVLSE